jgi:hypothetical protein
VEGVAALAGDHVHVGDLKAVGTSGLADGQLLARSGGGSWSNETLPSLLGDHGAITDLPEVSSVTQTDGHVLASGGSSMQTEALSSLLGDHATFTDIGNVSVAGASNNDVAVYDNSSDSWVAGEVSEVVRERGSLSIGDVSLAGSGRVIKQANPPTQRSDGSSLQEGDIWIETDVSPKKGYVYRNGAWQEQPSTLAGGNLVTNAISAETIESNTITANEIEAGTINSDVVDTNQLFADSGTIDDFTASTAMISEITNEVFRGTDATIENVLQVGTDTPNILIDGENDRIESSNYASGVEGFRINSDGFAEFEEGRFRGELRSTVVRKEEVTAVGGRDVVAPATQLKPELYLRNVVQEENDLVLDWRSGDERAARTPYLENTLQDGGDLVIEWGRRTKEIVVRNDRFDVGETIRMKDGQGGGREYIGTITEKEDLKKGTLLKLNTYVTSDWPRDTVVMSHTDRIEQIADGTFAPYTTYVQDDSEVVRIGNIEGTALNSGAGIVIGESDNLVYDTDDSELRVTGHIEAQTGDIAGLTIEDGRLRANALVIDSDPGTEDFVGYASPNGADLTSQIDNPLFNSARTGWTFDSVNIVESESNPGSYFVYPDNREEIYDSANNLYTLQYTGSVKQIIDVSSASGKRVEMIYQYAFNGDADDGESAKITVRDAGTNEILRQSSTRLIDNFVDNRVSVDIPDTTSNIQVEVKIQVYERFSPENWNGSNTQIPREVGFAGIKKLRVGDIYTRFDKEKLLMQDSNENTSLQLNREAGTILQKNRSSAPATPEAGTGMVYWQSGEPRVQDDAGNIYSIDLTQIN